MTPTSDIIGRIWKCTLPITTQDLNGNTLELYIGDFGVIRIVCSNRRDIFVQLLTYPAGPLVLIRDACVEKPYSEPVFQRGYRSEDDDVFGIGDQSPDGGLDEAERQQDTSAWDISTPRASTSLGDKKGVAWSGPQARYDTPFRVANNFSPGAKKFDNTPWHSDRSSPGANKFDNTPGTCSAPQKPYLRIDTFGRPMDAEKVDDSPVQLVNEWNGTYYPPWNDVSPKKQNDGWGRAIATNAFVFKKFDNSIPQGYTPTRPSKHEKNLGLLDLFEEAHRTPPQSPGAPQEGRKANPISVEGSDMFKKPKKLLQKLLKKTRGAKKSYPATQRKPGAGCSMLFERAEEELSTFEPHVDLPPMNSNRKWYLPVEAPPETPIRWGNVDW